MKNTSKRAVTIITVIALVFALLGGTAVAVVNVFPDAMGHWAEQAIMRLYDRGIIKGYPDGLVRPDQMISRAEFSSLLARYLELDTSDVEKEPPTFSDIDGHWAEKSIEALIAAGVIDPADYDGSFKPNEAITRIEIIRMMVRLTGKGDEAKQTEGNTGFADDDAIKDNDKGYVIIAKDDNLVNGYPDGTVRPDGETTRGEAAELIDNLDKSNNGTETPGSTPTPTPSPTPGGGSGGGSTSYPRAQISFELPSAAYTDTEIPIIPTIKYARDFVWSLTKTAPDGSETAVELAEAMRGTLTKEGGSITFITDGTYTLTATATNATGRETVLSRSITVYPVADVGFTLPAATHTDRSMTIALLPENLYGLDVVWSVTKDGETVQAVDALDGVLNNEGGTFAFKDKGQYSLTATATDTTGRSFTHSQAVKVYPVANISFDLPASGHTDKPVEVKTTLAETNGLTVAWSLIRNGDNAALSDYLEGGLDDNGGTIRFMEKGVYALKAAVTDDTGRTFEAIDTITIYPVGSIGFYMPEITHTDREIAVEATFENLDGAAVQWSLTKNGQPVSLSSCIAGSLGNDGGDIRFTVKGEYVLTASFSDPTGREYSYTSPVTVYPVPTLSFSLPAAVHTDTDIQIEATGADLDGLTVEWLLDNTYGFQDWNTYVTGSLRNDGGTIRIKHAGVYELVARVTDATGRIFVFEPGDNKVEVLPVLAISFDLPAATHIDRTVDLRTMGNIQTLPVEWSVTKDGKSVSFPEVIEGTLNAQGGKIRFVGAGEYVLTASMTDALNRTFSFSDTITVYPIPEIVLSLPQTGYAGEAAEISVSGTDLNGLTSVWTVSKAGDEAAPYTIYADGELSENGGNIFFKDKGVYTVIVTMTDTLGRSFSQNRPITIYPIPQIHLTIPQASYVSETTTFTVTGTDLESLSAVWTVSKDGGVAKPYADYADGELTGSGGNIAFRAKGSYALTVTMTDMLGRNFSENKSVTVYPIPAMQTALPAINYSGEPIPVTVTGSELGGLDIEWLLSVDGGAATPYNELASGSLGANGGELRISTARTISIRLTAVGTDANGRSFSFTSSAVSVKPVAVCSFTVPAAVHVGNNVNVSMQTVSGLEGKNIAWSLTKDGNPASYAGSLGNNGGSISIGSTGTFVLTAKVTDDAGRTFSYSQTISITNTAPYKPTGSATVVRSNAKEGNLFVTFAVSSADPDGDTVSYEYSGQSADGYYADGTHTVRVRAKDAYGLYSDWTDITFNVINSAPSTPVISRTPGGNSVAPGTPVTITATSTDADGDAITYVWDNRPSQTATYPLGRNVVKVKAVDSTGAESPWAAIIFFVADANHGGGMTLTGPESTIIENGLDGATIQAYTFTVPPVSGHSGQDFGRVRGYNIQTGVWDQLDYQTTSNGITFTRTLTPGIYSKLEMYYYTNHDCSATRS
jgi:hypothetical protein